MDSGKQLSELGLTASSPGQPQTLFFISFKERTGFETTKVTRVAILNCRDAGFTCFTFSAFGLALVAARGDPGRSRLQCRVGDGKEH